MFSVVIPLFNKAQTINDTLQSVLKQSFKDFEVIIVNDGSTDNSLEVVKSYYDSRIKIVSQKNNGVSAARNTGIRNSNFEHVAFLDGDDLWEPDFLFQMSRAINKYPEAGMYGCGSKHVNWVTGKSSDATVKKYYNKIAEVDCFKNPEVMPHTSAVVLKKYFIRLVDSSYEAFPYGMIICEDWACFHRVILISSLVYIGLPLGIRYNNVEGQITGISYEKRITLYPDVIRYYNLMYSFFKERKIENKYFIPFIKYQIRHRFKGLLKSNSKEIISMMVSGLDKNLLNSFEYKIYSDNKYKKISDKNSCKIKWKKRNDCN